MNPIEFVKNYLSLLGIPDDELGGNTAKVFLTVTASSMQEQQLTEEQQKKIEGAVSLLAGDKKQEGVDLLKTIFEEKDVESFRAVFSEKLADYLSNMTDNLSDSLSKEQKQKLAELINSVNT